MLTRTVRRGLFILCLVLASSLSVLPTAVSQTSVTTVTSAYTLTLTVATGTFSTVTSFWTNTTSLTVNLTKSVNSTYTSTRTSEPSTSATQTPGSNFTLLVIVNILIAIFLLLAVIRYMKRRRK